MVAILKHYVGVSDYIPFTILYQDLVFLKSCEGFPAQQNLFCDLEEPRVDGDDHRTK